LGYLLVILYIFADFGTFYQEKSGNPVIMTEISLEFVLLKITVKTQASTQIIGTAKGS
jgi:hypothetical protein